MTTINGWHFSCFLSLIWCVLISEYFIPHIVLLFAFESLSFSVCTFFFFFIFCPLSVSLSSRFSYFFCELFSFYFCLFIFFLMSVSIFFCFVRSFCFQRGACTFSSSSFRLPDFLSFCRIWMQNLLWTDDRWPKSNWSTHFNCLFDVNLSGCCISNISHRSSSIVWSILLRFVTQKWKLLNGQHSNRNRNVFCLNSILNTRYTCAIISLHFNYHQMYFVRLRFEGLSFDGFPFSHISLSQKYIKWMINFGA